MYQIQKFLICFMVLLVLMISVRQETFSQDINYSAKDNNKDQLKQKNNSNNATVFDGSYHIRRAYHLLAINEVRETDKEDETTGAPKEKKEGASEIKIKFRHIHFGFDKYRLSFLDKNELDRVAKILKNNNKIRVEMGGHTDNIGTRAYNQFLSKKRAQSVSTYVEGNGVDPSRMEVKGYGEDYPRYDNRNKEGRRLNRHVEIVKLPKPPGLFADATLNKPVGGNTPAVRGNTPAVAIQEKLGYYTVQVGAFQNPKTPDSFQQLDNVKVLKGNDGIYRYHVGTFASDDDAKRLLKSIIAKGYQDAFVRF